MKIFRRPGACSAVMDVCSGVLAYDFSGAAYPVVGWSQSLSKDGLLTIRPLVLRAGRIEALIDNEARFGIVGTNSEMWEAAVEHHSEGVG
jgi:hypothetical protein